MYFRRIYWLLIVILALSGGTAAIWNELYSTWRSQYALMYPEHVSALVLVDGLVLIPDAPDVTPPSMLGEEGLKARESVIRSMFGPSTTPALQQRIVEMMLGPSETAAHAAMQATFDRSHWSSDPVTAPVLAIYADGSRLADRDGMKRLYPTLEYHEIPETDHFLMMEKPDAFNRLLTDFLARIDKPTNSSPLGSRKCERPSRRTSSSSASPRSPSSCWA